MHSNVVELETWMINLEIEDYGFIRIGEEIHDIETEGDFHTFDLYVSRSINLPVELKEPK